MMKKEDIEQFERGDLVLVDWVDIFEDSDVSPDKRGATVNCQSVGWFDEFYVHPTRGDTLVIVLETRDNTCDKQSFPLGCVVLIRRLFIEYSDKS